jgi:hypothetical protein
VLAVRPLVLARLDVRSGCTGSAPFPTPFRVDVFRIRGTPKSATITPDLLDFLPGARNGAGGSEIVFAAKGGAYGVGFPSNDPPYFRGSEDA